MASSRSKNAPRLHTPRSPPARRPSPASVVTVGLVAIVCWVFWPVHEFDFAAYDDFSYVVENPQVAAGLNLANLRWAFEHAYEATGGPLTWLSHMADVEWFGMAPGYHHVVNVVIHVLATLTLFFALRSLTGSVWRAGAVAALFGVHPLHVESVAWIAERKDVLFGLFWFLTMLLYSWYVRQPSWGRYSLVVVAFLMGALSKPMVATLPFVLLLLDLWPLRRVDIVGGPSGAWRLVLLEKLPLLIIGATSLALTLGAQKALGAVSAMDTVPLALRLENAIVAYATYLSKTVWPSGLVPYYPVRVDITWVSVSGALMLLAAITSIAYRRRRDVPALGVGWLWFLGTLVPVIGLVQVGGHSMADRFTYLPLVGLFVGVIWHAHSLMTPAVNPRVIGAVTVCVVIACAVTARAQVMHWRNGETLWQHAVAVDPQNSRAHSNLGAVWQRNGRHHAAIGAFRESIRLHPDVPQTHYNLGLALEETGQVEDAIVHYREAIRLNAAYAKPRAHLASLLAQSGQTDEAVMHFQKAADLDPDDAMIRVNWGITLGKAGRQAEGVEQLRRATELDPRNVEWRYITALMQIELGQIEAARATLEEALRVDPSHASSKAALTVIRQTTGR